MTWKNTSHFFVESWYDQYVMIQKKSIDKKTLSLTEECLKFFSSSQKMRLNYAVWIIIYYLAPTFNILFTQLRATSFLFFKSYVQHQFIKTLCSFYVAYGPSNCTAQKMKFSIKDFFRKCNPIRRKLRIWSHLLKKSLMENLIFCVVLN